MSKANTANTGRDGTRNGLREKLQRKIIAKKGTLSTKIICLTMIVRNESCIITRCLDSLVGIINRLSIVDTGSTDDTKEIIRSWCKKNKIIGTVHEEPFRNFSYSRTHSLRMASETYPETDYFLLSDADMVWEKPGIFDPRLLFEDSYLVQQYDKRINYWNTRLLSNKINWQCVGVTHEYWARVPEDAPTCTGKINTLRIDDRADGGCKQDKFERDERLLKGALVEDGISHTLEVRYHFYLAQTLKDMGRSIEAIEYYRKRIAFGGWPEEVYYSYYQTGNCYERIGWLSKRAIEILKEKAEKENVGKKVDEDENEKSDGKEKNDKGKEDDEDNGEEDKKTLSKVEIAGKTIEELTKQADESFEIAMTAYHDGWKYRPTRAESLYALVRLRRTLSHHQLSYDLAIEGMKIKMTGDSLFVERDAYDYLFSYEISIVANNLPEHKEEGREALLKLLDREDLPEWVLNNCRSNAKYYL